MPTTKSFRFLDLPPEIRTKIYTLLVHSTEAISFSPTHIAFAAYPPPTLSPFPKFPHALLLTCTQIYHEIRPLFFTTNTFIITIRSGKQNNPWSFFLSPSFLDNRRQIRSLRLIILRWGTKKFFRDTLVPILEDCILNGRLRELEVAVRRNIGMEYYGNRDTVGFDAWSEERGSWGILRALLRDPYLERVVLRIGVTEKVSWEECEDISCLLGDGLGVQGNWWLSRSRRSISE
jgi:hypothetical protein